MVRLSLLLFAGSSLALPNLNFHIFDRDAAEEPSTTAMKPLGISFPGYGVTFYPGGLCASARGFFGRTITWCQGHPLTATALSFTTITDMSGAGTIVPPSTIVIPSTVTVTAEPSTVTQGGGAGGPSSSPTGTVPALTSPTPAATPPATSSSQSVVTSIPITSVPTSPGATGGGGASASGSASASSRSVSSGRGQGATESIPAFTAASVAGAPSVRGKASPGFTLAGIVSSLLLFLI